MTTPYMTSNFRTRARGRRCLLSNQFTVEIQDFDGEQVIYEVSADSHHEAAREAHELADADGIQINIMIIYEF